MKYSIQKMIISRTHLLGILLISLFGCSLYFQTYNYEYTADDGIYSHLNTATSKGLKSTTDLFQYGSMNFINSDSNNSGIYRPFTLFTFALEKQVFNEFNPAYGHAINIVIYFLTLVAIGLFLVGLFNLKNIPFTIPLLMLLLFAVHPIHVEAVASIKSRDTLLSCLFAFSAVNYWMLNFTNQLPWKKMVVGLLFFTALLSKEESLTFIAVLFLLSWYFLNLSLKESLVQTIPFVIAAGVYLIIRSIVLDAANNGYDTILNNIIYSLEGTERVATNFYIYLFYIKLLIFPHPLSWDYSFNQIAIKTMSDGWVVLSLILFSVLIYVASIGFKKKTILSFAILFYLVTFSIFSNIVPAITIGATVAERFMFVPSLAFCIILVYGIYSIAILLKLTKNSLTTILIVLPFVILYASKSITRTAVWKNNLTLTTAGISDSPKSWRTHMLYADNIKQQAETVALDSINFEKSQNSSKILLQEAVFHYKIADSIIGNNPKTSLFFADLADCYLRLKDTAAAKQRFLQAVENPNFFYGLFKLGMISFNEKEYQAAVEYYQKALLASSPDFFSTYQNLALSYQKGGDFKSAILFYKKALEYGNNDQITTNLSFCYLKLGRVDEAKTLNSGKNTSSTEEKNFIEAINNGFAAYKNKKYVAARQFFEKCSVPFEKYGGPNKFPNFLNAFGHSLLETNATARAKSIFEQAVNTDPKNYFALKNLGFILFQYEKNYDQAIQYYNRSLQANSPDYFQSYSNLGTAYLVQNKPDEAIKNYELALKYGTSTAIISNLYLLWKAKGNQDKMAYYQAKLSN
ncbi:MAG: tetratricopeptide repeat protein [Flavobacteriaceae bacterium]|nr:tetratricopeptide repeat protein [Flavobacteriaceae bacterium]